MINKLDADEGINRRTSLKIRALHSHIAFPVKLGAVSDEHGERPDTSMIGDYYWFLQGDCSASLKRQRKRKQQLHHAAGSCLTVVKFKQTSCVVGGWLGAEVMIRSVSVHRVLSARVNKKRQRSQRPSCEATTAVLVEQCG